ncbi:MAG: glycosyltransferase [Dissulfuribacterales bacterium]
MENQFNNLRKDLAMFVNKYRGRRAFIIGNGPSLNKLDLTKLKNEITFGVNSIFYLFDEMGFKPTFYVVEDKLVAEDRADEINQLSDMVKIFGEYLNYCLKDKEDIIWANVNFDYSEYPGFPHFSKNAAAYLWVGGTVTYLCMQLAYYMGFDKVYLIGFDHSYTIPPDAKVEGTVITSTSDDPNHFNRDYFGKGKRWHDPRLDRMEQAYRRALQVFEESGREIYNATAGGKLEIFPRVDYDNLFIKADADYTIPKEPVQINPAHSITSHSVKDDPLGQKDMRISVVVCTHRNPDLLAKTLDSLSRQTLNKELFEVIVVDNNSQDNTKDVVGKYSEVRYVLETELGLSHARNTGISAARGDIIAFIDDDAEASPVWVEALLKTYDSVPQACAVGGKVLPIWDAQKPEWLTEKYYRSLSLVEWGENPRSLHWPERIIGTNCSFRRQVFTDIGHFDTSLGRIGSAMLGNEDTEIQQRIHSSGHLVYYTPQAVVYHHVPASRMTKEYFQRRLEGTRVSEVILTLRSQGRNQEVEQLTAGIRKKIEMSHSVQKQQAEALKSSNQLLAQYKDKHRGQRCVIIGNGPSLNKMDLSFLKDEITFGMNRIYLMFDKWNFTPTYYVSVNPLVIEQSVDEILNIPATKFLSLNGLPYVPDPSDIIFLRSIGGPSFTNDPRNGLWEGYTVTYVAMQLAYFMGFNEVILIGVDHHFTTPGRPNQEVVSNGDDPNHFHPGYFGKGVRWNLPDLKNSEIAYSLAKQAFEADGRRIIDATFDGELNIFQKENYQELFEKYRKIDQIQKGNLSEPTFLNQQGEDLFGKGDLEGTLDAFTKAIEINPNFAPAHNNLGVLYWQAGEVQKAIDHFARAMEIDPNDRDTILNCGELFKSLNKIEDAKNIYSFYLQKNPNDEEIVRALADLQDKRVIEVKDEGEKYLVSAIVSTYNSERFIRGCLEDLEAQTIADRLEIIVVNSASEQNEEAVVKEFQEKYPNIKYIKTDQRETIYAAWNRGIKAASGKYITNANTDDRHRKEAFELLANVLDENQDIALVYADQVITEKENETLEKHTQAGFFFWPDFDRNYLLKVCSIGPQPMWRKSVHQEFGYFDESMHVAGDYEFWLRITQKYSLKHIPELLGLYFRSSQNAEYRNHRRTMQETTLIQSYYKTKFMLNEPQIQDNPMVSIIIPTYNRPHQLETALKSIALQSYKNIEVVVVNDGGEDVSAVIGKFKDQLAIQYINCKQNRDRSAARNTGLKNARGEYIAYLDDDDIFHTDHIETALRVLTNSDYKIVYSDAFRAHQKKIDGNYQTVRKDIPYSIDYRPGIFLKTNITPILCIIHEKTIIDEIGYFDESLPVLEDWDLWIRISQKYEFYHIKKVTCEFTWRDDGSTTTSAKIDQFAKYRQIITERYLKKISPQKEKNQRPLVSIIMLTFNELQYTKKCIKSIFKHTKEPFELIVVDNGSTDGTVEYLESEGESRKPETGGRRTEAGGRKKKGKGKKKKSGKPEIRIKIIKNRENLGFSAGNNQGMAAAKGNYVVLMNNDLVVTPGWLTRMMACAEQSSQIGIVGPVSNYVSGPQLVKEVNYDTTSLARLNKFSTAFAKKHAGQTKPFWRVVGFCMLIKRAVIEKIGGLDGRYGLGNFEDDDFSLRAALAGFESWIAQDCFVHHFGSRTFAGAKINYQESLHKNWEIFKHKWGIPADVAYGAPYDMGSVVKEGFIPAKHYCPLNPMEYSVADGEQLFGMGDIEGAKRIFEQIVSTDPDNIEALNNLGVIAFQQGGTDQAVSYFTRVLETDENYFEAIENLGKCAEAQKDYQKAAQWFERALTLKPDEIGLLNSLGNCFIQAENLSKAREVYEKSFGLDGGQENIRVILRELEKMIG